jgi:hypothetical protein
MARGSRAAIVTAGVAIAIAAIVIAYRQHTDGDLPTAVAPTQSAPEIAVQSAPPPPRVAPPASTPDYQREVRESVDVLATAEKLYVLAKQGDAAAQYALHLAQETCRITYNIAFKKMVDDAEPELTLEEALAKEAEHPFLGAEGVVALQRKCRRYREKDETRFGGRDEWLYASADGRYPLAEAEVAVVKAIEAHEKRNPGQSEADRAEALRLAIDALRDGDPAAVQVLGSLAQGFDMRHHLLGEETWSWLLAACRRGWDCSAQADWVQNRCRSEVPCEPGITGEDLIRMQAGPRFEAWEKRAAEVNLAIDEKRWDDLGF